MPARPARRPWLACLAVTALLLSLAASARSLPQSVAQPPASGPPGAESADTGIAPPATVSLELRPGTAVNLSQRGSCCTLRDLLRRPPDGVRVPEAVGKKRRFAVLELGAPPRPLVSFEEARESGGQKLEILVRVDANLNGDLTDDPLVRCVPDRECGPLGLRVRYAGGTAPYRVMLRYHEFRGRRSLGYSRDAALVGTLPGGRRIAVIDEDTNGSYDDPTDLVAFDFDGDGALDAGVLGRERIPRLQPFPVDDHHLAVAVVDPVKSTLTVQPVAQRPLHLEVRSEDGGEPVPGARVRVEPGAFEAVGDAEGRVSMQVLAGQVDYVSVHAEGFWGRVLGQSNGGPDRSGEDGTLHVALEAVKPSGDCPAGAHFCGHQRLGPATPTDSILDLDTGVIGPRLGAFPGPPDVGWVNPEGAVRLVTPGLAPGNMGHLGRVDFGSVSAADLAALPLDRDELLAGNLCGNHGEGSSEHRLRPRSVIGVRTAEGRLAKLQVRRCDREVELVWVVYSSVVGAAASSAAIPPAPDAG